VAYKFWIILFVGLSMHSLCLNQSVLRRVVGIEKLADEILICYITTTQIKHRQPRLNGVF